MSSHFFIEEKDNICIITLIEMLKIEELIGVLNEVNKLTNLNRRLWILTGKFAYDSEDIRKIAEHGKKLWPVDSRVAYVGEDDLTFGLLHMFEVFREEDNYQTKIFRDKENAIKWLKDWEHK